MKKNILIAILALFSSNYFAQTEISADNIKKHITFLADDKLQGRGTGSEGEKMAGNYISNLFAEYKLAPSGGTNSYFYTFKFKPKPYVKDSVEIEYSERTANDVVGYL